MTFASTAAVATVVEPRPAPPRQARLPMPERTEIVEVGEFVAQKWILTRGRDNIGDLLPGPLLPTVIDKELLVEAEKELGISLRPHEKARLWVRDGFWSRVGDLTPPSLFVWGDEDPLVPLAFASHIADALPQARQVVLHECGHVPQVELPEDTNSLIHDFIDSTRRRKRERAVAQIDRARRRLLAGGARAGGEHPAEAAASAS